MADEIDDDMEKFKCVCPACSEVFDLDSDALEVDPDLESLDIQCPVCGHEQNITRL